MPVYALPSLLSWIFLLGLGFVLTRNLKNMINLSFSVRLFGMVIFESSLFFLLLTKNFSGQRPLCQDLPPSRKYCYFQPQFCA